MTRGIEIYLDQLNDVKISKDGKSVTISGGTKSKKVTQTLWASNKQTGKSIPHRSWTSSQRTRSILIYHNSHWLL